MIENNAFFLCPECYNILFKNEDINWRAYQNLNPGSVNALKELPNYNTQKGEITCNHCGWNNILAVFRIVTRNT